MVIPPVIKSQQKNEFTVKMPIVTRWLLLSQCYFSSSNTFQHKSTGVGRVDGRWCTEQVINGEFFLFYFKLEMNSNRFQFAMKKISLYFPSKYTYARKRARSPANGCCFDGRCQTNIKNTTYHLHLLVVSTNLLIVTLKYAHTQCKR